MSLIPTPEPKFADLSRLTVGVVDDNATTARLVSDVLRASGVGMIHQAASGAEALEHLARWRPDILFLDWQMPVMDGLELTRLIRRAAVAPDPAIPDPQTPIIMLTGRRTAKDVDSARRAGVNEFVAKPFTPGALLSRIESVLRQPRNFVVGDEYVGPDRRRRRWADYVGPMRRAVDPSEVISDVERSLARQTIAVELDALRKLASSRGGADRQTLQMCYRAMQHNVHRARAVRDKAVEQASAALVRYMEATGGPGNADPKVVQAHMDSLSTLLELAAVDARKIVLIGEELDKASVPKARR